MFWIFFLLILLLGSWFMFRVFWLVVCFWDILVLIRMGVWLLLFVGGRIGLMFLRGMLGWGWLGRWWGRGFWWCRLIMLFLKSKLSMGYVVWCGWVVFGVVYFLFFFGYVDCENDVGDGLMSILVGVVFKNMGFGIYGMVLGWEVGFLVFLVGWLGIML